VRINTEQLRDVIIEVARRRFGTREFARRDLMDAVESHLRSTKDWTNEDDDLSGSRGLKSRGLAQIDWRITDLKKDGRLINKSRDKWRLL
jgi:hypothetical protein